MLADLQQELMTPDEAARWFRRSPSWLRQQKDLLRLGGPNGQPLFHVRVCRAWVLGRLCDLGRDALRRVQLQALAAACGLESLHGLGTMRQESAETENTSIAVAAATARSAGTE